MIKLRSKIYQRDRVASSAMKRLVISVSSVQPTPLIERKAEELSKLTERASKARFLDKYRRAEAA